MRTHQRILHAARWAAVALSAHTFALTALAQSPLPDSFNPGANDIVYCLALQTDGKILVTRKSHGSAEPSTLRSRATAEDGHPTGPTDVHNSEGRAPRAPNFGSLPFPCSLRTYTVRSTGWPHCKELAETSR